MTMATSHVDDCHVLLPPIKAPQEQLTYKLLQALVVKTLSVFGNERNALVDTAMELLQLALKEKALEVEKENLKHQISTALKRGQRQAQMSRQKV